MKRLTTIAALAVFSLSSAQAAEPLNAVELDTANNMAHEHLICAAYVTIVSACLIQKNPNDPLAARYKQYNSALLERGFLIGEIATVSFNASKARFEMARASMMKEIENNCSNVSILLQQHAEKCVALYNEGTRP